LGVNQAFIQASWASITGRVEVLHPARGKKYGWSEGGNEKEKDLRGFQNVRKRKEKKTVETKRPHL